MMAISGAATVHAQGVGATTAVAPRLDFSSAEMELARALAATPGVAAFYGDNGLQPIFGGRRVRHVARL